MKMRAPAFVLGFLMLTVGAAELGAGVGDRARGAGALQVYDSPQAEPVIGGFAMRCEDFRGRPVQTMHISLRGDVGRATFISAVPVIALDPDRLAMLPQPMQIFFYAHECAHHVLAHIINPTFESEREADCWSIQQGRAAGYFTRRDVEGFAPYLAHSRGSAFGHLPGPERHAHLLACYDAPAPDAPRSAHRR